MVWQRNDDQYGVSRKITRIPRGIRLAAVGMDQLAMNYSVRALTDGVLDESELEEVLATEALIDALVKVDRWHRTGHDCARCVQPPAGSIVIHDFLEYNPDAASVGSGRDEKAKGGREGNHKRWHVQRGISVASCEWCAIDKRSDNRSPNRHGRESDTDSLRNPPGPVPVPELPDTDVTHLPKSGHVGNARAKKSDQALLDRLRIAALADAQRLGVSDLAVVRDWLERASGCALTMGQAVELAGDILARARGEVREPDRYVIGVCRKSPHRVAEYAAGRDLEAVA